MEFGNEHRHFEGRKDFRLHPHTLKAGLIKITVANVCKMLGSNVTNFEPLANVTVTC